MTPPSSRAQSVVGPLEPYRYEVICWEDDCEGSLDTYGHGQEVVEWAREHVEQYGHALTVQVKARINVTPGEEPTS